MKTSPAAAAADHNTAFTHVPVFREVLADFDTPLSAYLKLCHGKPNGFLFESVQGGERWGRYSIIGLPAKREIRIHERRLSILDDGIEVRAEECRDPLQAIRELMQEFRVAPVEGLPRFSGGLVGYFGADLLRYLEPKLAAGRKPSQLDDIRLLLATDLVVFDTLRGSAFLVTLRDVVDPDGERKSAEQLDAIETALRQSPSQPVRESVNVTDFESLSGKKAFVAGVERIREYIREGDAMQVVLSQRLQADFDGDALDVYRALRMLNPSPYLFLVNFGDLGIAGSSPEALVRVEDGNVTVRPIAGTRPRGGNAEEDAMLERELHADPKERAEHLMLIDLGRNDVGRVATTGSVRVTERMVTERYSHVMHLVSNVTAQLDARYDALDALAAAFPAGTLAGAPKLRALEIIDELEPVAREVYSGAIGYLGWNGNLDTAIAIRTAVIHAGRLQVQAGAGVVYDSEPLREWEETLNKSRALLEAVKMVAGGMRLAEDKT